MNRREVGWPALPYEEWRETKDTLHMYAQVIGKLRLALSPPEPQWAHVPLYVTARGLTTSPIPVGLRTIDLALTRYSGRAVEPPSGAGIIRRLGGDAEVICAGWWAGDERVKYPAFFAYGYPAPDGIERVPVQPREAEWSSAAGEFLLPYDAVRSSREPRRAIHEFLDSTYRGAASLMQWSSELTDAGGVP